jgi:hypothetical protein
MKSASKIGSSTSFNAAWTTRSAMVGTVFAYCPLLQSCFGISVAVRLDDALRY